MTNIQSVTEGISQQVTSAQQYTSLTFVNPRIKVSDSYHHNVMLSTYSSSCPPHVRSQESLSARQCRGAPGI